jgi:hypothetical protein
MTNKKQSEILLTPTLNFKLKWQSTTEKFCIPGPSFKLTTTTTLQLMESAIQLLLKNAFTKLMA